MGSFYNPFDHPDFSLISMTRAINKIPNRYGRIRELRIFPFIRKRHRVLKIEERNGVLILLQTMPVGSPGQSVKIPKRNVRFVEIPHIPVEDSIMPDEYTSVREMGTESAIRTVASVVTDHLTTIRDNFSITLEHLRAGALSGMILDADDDFSLIYNLFEFYGLTENVVDFELSKKTTDVRAKCMEVNRLMDDGLEGEVMTGTRGMCGEDFFSKLTGHDDVRDTFRATQEAVEKIGGDIRRGFNYGGITFEEYRGRAVGASGKVRHFIPKDGCRFFPEGTRRTFGTYLAPAPYISTVNTPGRELYAQQKMRDWELGVDIRAESNPLPFCHRPKVLIKGIIKAEK